jgi:hypothetical protein
VSDHPQHVAWLKEERARHLFFGREDRAALVDAELASYGVAPKTTRVVPKVETASEPKPDGLSCDVCDRTFKSAAALGSHARTHKGDGPKAERSSSTS